MGVSDPAAVAKKLVFAHVCAAQFLRLPELMLREDEADALVKEYTKLCQHYGVSALPEVWELWIGVVTTLGMIYGPRGFVIYNRLAAPKKPQAEQTAHPPTNGVEPIHGSMTFQ